MKITRGEPELIRFESIGGKEFRALLTEFPNGQVVASILVTDSRGTRELLCTITSSREEAMILIHAGWTDLEHQRIENE